MSNTVEVKVPDIGDFEEVEIIEVLVSEGDAINVEDSVITLESDKATMEIPAPNSGTVSRIAVSVGDRVSRGDLIMTMTVDSADTSVDHVHEETGGSDLKPEKVAASSVAPGEADMHAEVLVLGEDVGVDGGVFRATDGLYREFGGQRVLDTRASPYESMRVWDESVEPDSHGALRGEFPGGWPDHERNAFTGQGLAQQERDAQAFTRKLLNWRKHATVIHSGKLMQFTPVGNVYAYFRYDHDDTVMVIFNRGDDTVEFDTARFAERLDGFTHGTDVISGDRVGVTSTLKLDPLSVLVLELE